MFMGEVSSTTRRTSTSAACSWHTCWRHASDHCSRVTDASTSSACSHSYWRLLPTKYPRPRSFRYGVSSPPYSAYLCSFISADRCRPVDLPPRNHIRIIEHCICHHRNCADDVQVRITNGYLTKFWSPTQGDCNDAPRSPRIAHRYCTH